MEMMDSALNGNIIQLQKRAWVSAEHVLERDPLLAVEKSTILDGLFSLLEGTPGLATITNIKGRILYLNDGGRRMLGISSQEVVDGCNLSRYFSTEGARQLHVHAIPLAMRNGIWRGESTLVDRSGTRIPVSQVIIFQRGSNGRDGFLLSIAWDMSKQKWIEKELRHRATHDDLTGLPNRALLSDRLKHALHSANRNRQIVGVVFMDLNGFKEINDRYGHENANEVLKAVAHRLSASTRSVDTVVRYGGDEFVLVLPDLASADRIDSILDRIRRAMAEPVRLGGRRLVISASAGVAVYPRDGRDATALLQYADQQMYSDKRRRCAKHATVSGNAGTASATDINDSQPGQKGV